MKKITILISAFLLLLNASCAVKSPRLQEIVQSRINETKKDSTQHSNIEIKINKNIELANECKQEKSSYIPALLYWGWNSEIVCEFSKETLTREMNNFAKGKIETTGLNKSLENKKLIINIDELPTRFKFQAKVDIAIFIIAYSVSEKKYFAPETKNFKGNYKIVDAEGKVVLEKEFLQNNNLAAVSNPNKLTKKLAWQFIDSYNNELDRFISVLLDDVKTNLETNSLTQQQGN